MNTIGNDFQPNVTPQWNPAPQQGYNNVQYPVNPGYMQPYAPEQPSITYHVNNIPVTEDNLPEKFQPISMWGYFGYNLLFSIPLIGFIMLCVYAFGGSHNVNLRNYARSFFCSLIIFAIVFVILMATGGLSALFSSTR